MSKKKWIKASKNKSIAFLFPCPGSYNYVRSLRSNIGCTKPKDQHGHIQLNCKNGYVFIPFRCYSQAGIKAAIEHLNLEEDGFKGILDLPEVKKLPEELAEQEKLILASPSEIKKLAKIRGYWNR